MWGRATSQIALAAVVAVAIAACGSSGGAESSQSTSASNGVASKPADQILATAIKAARTARSVHVKGTVRNGSDTIAIDLSITSGDGATGTIAESRASFKLIAAGGFVYIQPSARFLSKFVHSPAAVQLLRGKWLKGRPSDSSFESFGKLTSIKGLMSSFTQGHGALTRGAATTVGGVRAIAVHSSRGGTMYVATTGKPYPLEVAKTGGTKTGKIAFTQYDQTFSISAPPKSVDLDQLQRSG